MSVLFLGSGPFALPALEAMVRAGERPVLVVTRPDRPGGRGRKPLPTPVREAASALGLAVEVPATVNDAAAIERLKTLDPEVAIVADYGEILRAPFLALPRVGTFNLHASLLPRHRGAAPVAAAILAGDGETGVTLFRIQKGLDDGPMVDRIATPIGPIETAGELEARLAQLAAELLLSNLPRLRSGRFTEAPQDASRATPAPKLPPGMGSIDWSRPADAVARFIRALSPRPGAFSFLFRGDSPAPPRIKLLRAQAVADSSPVTSPPGTVSRVAKHGFRVAAGGGEVEVLDLQPPGKGPQASSAFLRGHPVAPGDRFAPFPPG